MNKEILNTAKVNTICKYNPRKPSKWLLTLREILKNKNFRNEKAVNFLISDAEKSIVRDNTINIYDDLDEKLSKENKEMLLKNLNSLFETLVSDKNPDVKNKIYIAFEKAVKVVDRRFKEDFPTIADRIENKEWLQQSFNAEQTRAYLMTRVEVLNTLTKLYDSKKYNKEKVVKQIKDLGLQVIDVLRSNSEMLIYFSNEKYEDLYDYNIYEISVKKDKITFSYLLEEQYNVFFLNQIDEFKRPEVEQVEEIKEVKEVKKVNRVNNKYKLAEGVLDLIERIYKSGKNVERKLNNYLNEFGYICYDVKDKKFRMDFIKNNSIVTVAVTVLKTKIKVTKEMTNKAKVYASRKLKANVFVINTYKDTNEEYFYAIIRDKATTYTREVEVVKTNELKSKEAKVKLAKGFNWTIIDSESKKFTPMYFKTKQEAKANLVKFIEKN